MTEYVYVVTECYHDDWIDEVYFTKVTGVYKSKESTESHEMSEGSFMVEVDKVELK